jgi:alkylhydroperoxidase family enzyme
VAETHAPDDVYERVREQFSEDELAHLTLAVVAINGWNRLNVAARTVPGDYVAGSLATLHAAG